MLILLDVYVEGINLSVITLRYNLVNIHCTSGCTYVYMKAAIKVCYMDSPRKPHGTPVFHKI
jgi:hypothetical protein